MRPILLAAILIFNSVAWSEEALVPASESAGEASITGAELTVQDLADPSLILWLDPETITVMAVSSVGLFAIGASLLKWTDFVTQRRYRDAAHEATARLTHHDPAPITHSPEGSSLRQVSLIETELLRQNHPDARPTEGQLARLIILRSARLGTIAR